MSDKNVRLTAFRVIASAMLICVPTRAQRPVPTPVLAPQPDSPLEIVSMVPMATPTRTDIPPRAAEAMATYELVVHNKTDVPIMAYGIRHESQVETRLDRICQGTLGFSDPMIAARETKTIQSNLHKHGPTVTPVIDLVLLANGSYFGRDSCGYLGEYQKRLDERRAAYQTVMRRLQRDGTEKTALWLRQELDRDVGPLLTPKKLNAAAFPAR